MGGAEEFRDHGESIFAGYRITNEAGAWYTIPAALPAVPSGAFVVVVFDGIGSGTNEYDFSDKVATLHSGPGLENILGRTAGQCTLYDSSPFKLFLPGILNNYQGTALSILSLPTDFLLPAIPSFDAWDAAPGDRAAKASKADIWSKRWFKSPARGLGAGLSSAGPAVLSFVAWGIAPRDHAAEASKAGLWSPGWFITLARGLGVVNSNQLSAPNEPIGLLPGSQTGHPGNWTLYPAGQATKGSENPVPVITWFYPAAGATIDSATFSISWAPVRKATGYRFQMDNNSDFSSPMVNQILPEAVYIPSTPVAQGTYYWRVKVLIPGGESPWSNGVQITSESLTLMTNSGGPLGYASATLGIAWKLQRKDTNMLCLGGCDVGEWDQPHSANDRLSPHGHVYCVMASISMMASYYGGGLSQDRISYQIYRHEAPESSLDHNIGSIDTPPDWPQITTLVAWALGLAPADIPAQEGKPTFNQIKAWIDAKRPIMARIPGHMRIIDGYRELSATRQYIHLLDPSSDAKFVNYAGDNIDVVWVGPAGPTGAPNVLSDDAEIKKDSDGDGINDFDERYRFHTELYNPDSDNDLVRDKAEMVSYLFTDTGDYLPKILPDIDGDTWRKELDPDNDGGGLIDGCEDLNHTDSFKPEDDRVSSTTTISPTGTVYTSTPTYKWNAVCGAKSYWLQVDDTTGRGKIYHGYPASETGCPSGTGTCSVTPSISLADGNATWWIAACHLSACGPWSNALGFIVSANQDPVVGLWNTPDGGQARIEKATTGTWDYVGKVTVQSPFWQQRAMLIGDEVWWLDKQADGHYLGKVLVKGNFYWTMPMEVWVEGNVMKDSAGATVATRAQ